MRSFSKAPTPPEPPDREAFLQPFNHKVLLRYFEDVRSFHGAIKFLGMGSMREKVTKDVHLDSLFVMPRLHHRHVTAAESVNDPSALAESRLLLDDVQKNPRLVVLGDPGSGKSTLIQYLSDGLCRTLDNSVRNALGPLVPVPIILRELDLTGLSQNCTFEKLLEAWLNNKLRPVSAAFEGKCDLLKQLFTSGQALVLVDGLDEVGDENLRGYLREAIWDGMDRYPRTRWIVTSRIVGYSAVALHQLVLNDGDDRKKQRKKQAATVQPEAQGLHSPGKVSAGFSMDIMAKLTAVIQVTTLAYVAPFNQKQIELFAKNWMLAMGDNPHDAVRSTTHFIQGISERPATQLLAPTPVLLTFMGLVYRGMRDFPNGRAELFRFIVRAYVENIEKEKFGKTGIPAGLNSQIVERLLERIGWEAQLLRTANLNTEEAEDTTRELLIPESSLRKWMRSTLKDVLPPADVDPAIAALLRYLAERTGLIIPRGRLADSSGERQEHYSFLHLSIQEFMAARWLMERMTDDDWQDRERNRKTWTYRAGLPADSLPMLRERCGLSEWHEVFFLLHELWQKPTPLFRLFSANPWDNITSSGAIESLRKGIRSSDSRVEEQRMALSILLATVALDESNGLAMHRSFRYEVLKALHWKACLSWQLNSFEVAALLLRRGGLFELSKEALKAALKESSAPVLSLPISICENHRMLVEVLRICTNLENLALDSCADLSSLEVLEKRKLRVLWIGSCRALDLSALQRFSHLETLSISGLEYSNIRTLEKLVSLTSLFLMDCVEIYDLRPIQNLNKLNWLSLLFCSSINDINPLAKLQNLERLDLAECSAIIDLSPLKKLRKLRHLDISGCRSLRNPKRQIEELQHSLPRLKIIFN
ncbi:MAG TPA: hypothetical protein VGE29_05560 [Prosthecobacter sp.]